MTVDAEIGEECPTPLKRRHRSRAAARRFHRRHQLPCGAKDHLWPYLCPAGDHWHLTHQTPEEQRAIGARIAKSVAPTTRTQQDSMNDQQERHG